jgi:hypothetical protein
MKRITTKIGYPTNLSYLQEMAYPPSLIISKLLQYDDALLEHLLKLYYFKNYIKGWTNTVYKCIIRTYKNNKTNKWPTKEFLYRNLWENEKDAFLEHHNGYLTTFSTFKNLPKVQSNIEGATTFCESYFKWLSKELSKKGNVTLPEVTQKIESLLNI